MAVFCGIFLRFLQKIGRYFCQFWAPARAARRRERMRAAYSGAPQTRVSIFGVLDILTKFQRRIFAFAKTGCLILVEFFSFFQSFFLV
jgi:hypothetical protein